MSSRDGNRRSRSRSRDREESSLSMSSHRQPVMNGVIPPSLPAGIPGIHSAPQVLVPPSTGNHNNNNNNNSALSSILAAQQAAQDKVNRELFVGNTPQGTSEMLLVQFLNGAMKRVGLCSQDVSPIIQCRVNQKFAFVECTSIDYANAALNLNGIPFLGACLKVSRPSKYTGPYVPSKTWQELTGQPLPANVSAASIDTSGAAGGILLSAEEKVNRELFIGNTTPEMTEQMLKDFLGKAMEQVGLTTHPGNPITACRVSGKFAFIELRSPQEAAKALNLNNIPYLGAQLRVGRPSKYTGAVTPHGNWEDILAKYMSGELQLPSQGGDGATGTTTTADSAVTEKQTRVVEIQQMLTEEDFEQEDEYEDILEDTKEECSQFGVLKSVIIPKTGPGKTKVFLEYTSTQDAAKAIQGLKGRTFDGRRVDATYFDETKFSNQDYS